MKEWRHRWRRNWCRNAVNDWVVTLLLTWFYFNLLFLCLFFSWFNSISFLFYFLWFNLKSFDSNMLYSLPCIFFFFIVADTLSVGRSVGRSETLSFLCRFWSFWVVWSYYESFFCCFWSFLVAFSHFWWLLIIFGHFWSIMSLCSFKSFVSFLGI